jgi:phosphonate transport system substrate-binding protein
MVNSLGRYLSGVIFATLALAACGGGAAPSAAPVSAPASGAKPAASAAPASAASAGASAKPAASASAKPAAEAAGQEVVMAFTPSSDPNALLTNATPITDYLSKVSGLRIKPFITTDYTATIEAMTSKKVDVAWLTPASYVFAHDQNGAELMYKALRKNAKTGALEDTYLSTIIVPASSPAKDVKDLKGKRFAFVDPVSTSGYIYPAALLLKNGIDPKKDLTATFAGGHDSAALAVYQGNADAAATFEDAADQLLKSRFPDVNDKIRVLAKTDPIPNDPIAYRKDLDKAVVDKVKAGLKQMADDPNATRTDPRTNQPVKLLGIYRWDGVAEAKDSDYQPIRDVAKGLGIPLKELAPK